MELNKDFYKKINGEIEFYLEKYIKEYSTYEWFEEFWNRYREYVLDANNIIIYPGFMLQEYTNVVIIKNKQWELEA